MLCFLQTGGLDLARTLTCGQCFRWQSLPDGRFCGVVGTRAVVAAQSPGSALTLEGLGAYEPADDKAFWRNYFALDLDYAALEQCFCGAHPKLAACIECGRGIRVLRQPFFETLLTFIISQNNNIPRIAAITERLCEGFGEAIPGALLPAGGGGTAVPPVASAAETSGTDAGSAARQLYAFPTPEALAGHSAEDLAFLRAGWRAGYLLDAATRAANGSLDEAALCAMPTAAARAALMETKGVGPKVADCTLLFGLGRWEAYPVDVWMKKADRALFTARVKDAGAYLNRRTAGHAGIAQQYIFAWARGHLE